jgi:hypothetical protein
MLRDSLTANETESIRTLDDLSKDNLMCGRLTNHAVMHAMKTVIASGHQIITPVHADAMFPSHSITMLADVLNDMLSAGRVLCRREHGIEQSKII